MEDGTRRHVRWAVVLLALAAASLLALPALGATTKDLTVVPAEGASGSGLTDLRTLTYAQARDRLDQLSSITLPVAIPGMERLGASGVTVGSDDAGHSLALTGSAKLYGHDVDLLVTAIWADDASTQPKLAIAAKAKDIALSAIDPRWDASYGDAGFSTARVAVSTGDQEIDPAALPEAARGFFPEPVALKGGVSFAGSLQLTGRLADAFRYAGHSGDVELEGSVGASAAALFGHGGADLHLKATLGKSPDAPAWLAARTSTYELAIADGHPSVTVDEDVTLAVDGTSNRFKGHLAVASTGTVEGELDLDGPLDAPFGLDASKLSDVALRMARTENGFEGGLAFAVDGVDVDARFTSAGADFTVDGQVTVPKLVALGSDLLGTPVADVPGAGAVALDHVGFSFTKDTFSVGAKATVKELQADALLTLRTGRQPLLGLRLSDPGCDGGCVRLAALLPQLDGPLAGLKLPAVDLVATSLTELDADDLTRQEEDFFGPGPLSFSPGLNLEGRLPLDALGLAGGGEVALSGTLGVTLGGLDGSLKSLALGATLPAAATKAILPGWVTPTGPTTLSFTYKGHGVAASFATAASVRLGGSPAVSTTIAGALERSGDRTSIHLAGTLAGWRQPFGQAWLPALDTARLELDTTFGGGRPATVDASAGAAITLSGHAVDVDFALSTSDGRKASIAATLDHASVDELARGFQLGTVQRAIGTDELRGLGVDHVRASVTVGEAKTTFAITGTTRVHGVSSDVLVAVRGGNGFSLGIRPKGPIDLSALAPTPGRVTLPAAALVLGNGGRGFNARDLAAQEFDFYKPLYGCAPSATPADCADFRTLDLGSGLQLIAGVDLGDKLEQAAAAVGIQTGAHALLEGTVPVLGGTDFSLRAELGGFRFPVKNGSEQRPDWFDHGGVSLRIGRDGVGFDGDLGVRIRRDGARWMPACDGGHVIGNACYDVLDFKVSADVTYSPLSFTLTGGLVADDIWRNAFGQSWLAIKAVKLQLGVTVAPTGPQVTMGFLGDVTIGSKDVAAALKVGLAPLTAPPFVRVDLIGFSFASQAGLSLSDLLWLNEQITHTHLDASALPDVSLRNLYVQFAQQTDAQLCLTKGLRFNADLYAGTSLTESPAISDDDRDAATGCRKLDTDPQAPGQSCLDRRDEGCLATVYGRFDSGGLVAGGELNAFTLGPISLDHSSLALALTAGKQQLSLHGGVRIGTSSYEAVGAKADLDISKSEIRFAGDASLFNHAFEGYVNARADFDLDHPSFAVEGWLRADGRAAIASGVEPKVQVVRPVVTALGGLVQLLGGNGGVADIGRLPARLTAAGVPVPDKVNEMAGVLGDMQTKLREAGQSTAVSFDQLLKGLSFGVDGIPGVWTSNCQGLMILGVCVGRWGDPICLGTTVVDGVCWTTPPATVSIPGICDRLGVASANCSWAGLVRTYVRPALLGVLERAIHVDIDDGSFESVLNRLLSNVSSLVGVDCAYFSADGTALAQGRLTVQLAARLRLFGQYVGFGGRWDFATGSSPDDLLKSLIGSVLSPSAASSDCPAFPAGHEQAATGPAGAQLSSATLTPAEFDEGAETKLRATFADPKLKYPGLKVEWGDGTTTTLPEGEAATVTTTHAYAKSGTFPVRVWVLDDGGMVKRTVATVRNVAPTVTPFELDPLPANEDGTVTLRGGLTDPGADTETVSVDWGDGSMADVRSLDASTRRFTLSHHYADDGNYPVTVTVADPDGGTDTRKQPAVVVNVAPSAVSLKPTTPVTAGKPASFALDFTDPGKLDHHKATLDWGDGTPPQVVALPVGARHLELPHTYGKAGNYAVKPSVADDDDARGATVVSIQALSGS